ncbi:MAG: cyclic nucleotide-binding domain-containing protein [Spirochaetia bacterium]|nr:cyclic nucleotide-binding domain-containing protein [Spirochaetia bacterium]
MFVQRFSDEYIAMIIYPSNPRREFWDFIVLVITVYVAIVVPVRIALNYHYSSWFYLFEIIVTFIFSVDIYLNFNTAIKKGVKYITDKKEIAKKYKAKGLAMDILSAIPLFAVSAFVFGVTAQSLQVLRLFELNRLLKLHRMNHLLDIWRKRFQINPGTLRLLNFILILALVSHWIACIWIMIGGVRTDSKEYGEIYSLAIYWTVTTIATVGYGDITPQNFTQRMFAIMVMIVGAGSYGFVVGNISSLLASVDVVKASYRKKMEEISAFLNYRSIPADMQNKVHEYYDHIWESRLGHDESTMLNEIPEPLKSDIALFMRQDLIKKVPFFVHAEEKLLKDLVMSLQPTVYLPNSYVIKKGETGSCMYIISTGTVDVVSEDETTVYATLREGSFVGEMALVLDMPRTATVKTREYCDVYILDKSDFDKILEKYPDFAKHIQKITKERMHAMAPGRQDETGKSPLNPETN